ncbi:MAG: S8 family serine peptidase [Leptolyngbyaceae cyanobacterium RM2_2_4]|nr:S8 family serine peptidase [Leptolyngbyaceae cyanobacterium RM2_2_4]
MAAPHVAGAAALLLAQDNIQSAKQLKDALIGTVDTLPSLEGKVSGGGRLNAYKALLSLPINRQVEVVIDYVRGVGGFGEEPDFFVKVATDGINFVVTTQVEV